MCLPNIPSLFLYKQFRQLIGVENAAFSSDTAKGDRVVFLRLKAGANLIRQLSADHADRRAADRICQLVSGIKKCLYPIF